MEKASAKHIFNPLKALLASSLALLLLGCGGGGSGTNTTAEKQTIQPPTLEHSYYTIAEGVQATLAGDLHGADLASYATRQNSDLTVAASPDGQGLIIQAPQVNAPTLLDLSVKFTSAGRTFERSLSVYIQNTSAQRIEKKARQIIDDASSLKNLEQDYALYHFSVDTAYLYGLITHTEKVRLLGDFSPESSQAYAPLESELSLLSAAFTAYEKGSVTDSELKQHIDVIDALVEQHGDYGIQKLTDVSGFSNAVVPTLTSGALTFSEQAGFFSRFVGNPDYGQWQDAKFVLDRSYTPISSLIRTDLSQDIRCDAY